MQEKWSLIEVGQGEETNVTTSKLELDADFWRGNHSSCWKFQGVVILYAHGPNALFITHYMLYLRLELGLALDPHYTQLPLLQTISIAAHCTEISPFSFSAGGFTLLNS